MCCMLCNCDDTLHNILCAPPLCSILQRLSCGVEKHEHASEALRALLTRPFPVPRGFNARNLSLKLRGGNQDSTQRSRCHHLVWSRVSVWRQLWVTGVWFELCGLFWTGRRLVLILEMLELAPGVLRITYQKLEEVI